jgi:hypothetical protein
MAKQQYVEIEIPETLRPEQREALADLVIERIVDRTQSGLDKRGRAFPGYSKEYIKSLDFKNAGKSKGKVDLQLSGDMLAALELLNHTRGKLKIGFQRGTDENAKAEGNILGTYGRDTPIRGKKRDFLGVTKSELKAIMRELGLDD